MKSWLLRGVLAYSVQKKIKIALYTRSDLARHIVDLVFVALQDQKPTNQINLICMYLLLRTLRCNPGKRQKNYNKE